MKIRDDIVHAAAQVFGSQGYERATLAEIARAVGIQKASLYHHITSKEDLLFAIHERLANELIGNTRRALADVEEPAERLRAVLRVAMRLIADHKQEVTVFLQERQVFTSERWRSVVEKRDAYEAMVEGILAEGLDRGSFRALPTHVATLGILGMVNWGFQWFRRDGPLSADEIADLFADLVLNGLRSDPTASGAGAPEAR